MITRLQQQEAATTTEPDAQAQHLRAVEDRSHAKIDRARQESRDQRVRLTALEKQLTAEPQPSGRGSTHCKRK